MPLSDMPLSPQALQPAQPSEALPGDPAVDIAEARRLVDALERDLQGASGRAPDLALLLAEVAALRQVLHAEDGNPEEMHTSLHGIRTRLHDFPDELKGDAYRAGGYLAELGRILGL